MGGQCESLGLHQDQEGTLSRPGPGNRSSSRSAEKPTPVLFHTLHQPTSSALSLASSSRYVFAGSQTSQIYVYDVDSFDLVKTIEGHAGSVLDLDVSEERSWLFSSGGDGTVRVWSIRDSFAPLLTVLPRGSSSGDIFSLKWVEETSTLYFGTQSTEIQWINLPATIPDESLIRSPLKPIPSKFFDSVPITPSISPSVKPIPLPLQTLHVQETCVKFSAHYGYILSLDWIGGPGKGWLVSGAGSGDIKLWEPHPTDGLKLLATFDNESYEAVFSLAVLSNSTFCAGMQDGSINVFDLETSSRLRTLKHQFDNSAILSLTVVKQELFSCSADGKVVRWNSSFDAVESWSATQEGPILTSISVTCSGGTKLVTGGSDVKFWALAPESRVVSPHGTVPHLEGSQYTFDGDCLLEYLSRFISYRTVSDGRHREECRQGAIFLKNTLTQMGANSRLLVGADDRNPLVLGVFKGNGPSTRKRRRILFYGHYDVVGVNNAASSWKTYPWELVGVNGYLYGRGVSDNKGPILAVATAASTLLSSRSLDIDLVMIIEGEEEAGSAGFKNAMLQNRDLIGDVDCIILSNSYWIGEDVPCLTYGLRGVVHFSVEVNSSQPDLHSGVDGGVAPEPLLDMVALLSKVSHRGKVMIPGFYDDVRQISDEEQKLYEKLADATGQPASSLAARFNLPTVSISHIDSGSGSSTIIPSKSISSLSFRIVPDQDVDKIADSIKSYLETEYAALQSSNSFHISVQHQADWWLGDLSSPYYISMERAVRNVWGIEPLRIREGGSIPSIPFLEKTLGCQAIHIPMGQSSDKGHLSNERLRLTNLRNGVKVFEAFFTSFGTTI